MAKANDPKAALAEAQRALAAERPEEARDLLAALVEAYPGQGEAWLLLGRAEAGCGDAAAARAAFARCLALAPKEPVAWIELALFEASAGHAGAVVRRARKAELSSALVTMVQEAASGEGPRARGVGGASKAELAKLGALATTGPLGAAETLAGRLLTARQGAALWGLLARARAAGGRVEAAAQAYAAGLKLEPYAADLRLGLARAFDVGGDTARALVEARQAARIAPLWPPAQIGYGRMALRAGLTDRARNAAEGLLARRPGHDGALALAAETALQAGEPEAALSHAEARKREAPGRDLLLAGALAETGDMVGALDAYGAALGRAPEDADALTSRAQLLQSLGRAEEAERDLRAALDIAPGHGRAARALAYGAKLAPEDPAVGRMRAALADGRASAQDRRLLDYALARVTQANDPAASFAHLEAANGSAARSFPWDPRQIGDLLERAQAAWPRLEAALTDGAASECDAAPVFVTGLPRSGTTLIEAILSAHPDMRAGGELGVLRGAAGPLRDALAAGEAVGSALLTEAGAAYVAAARRMAARNAGEGDPVPEGARLTDKSIFSFLEIGLIRTILPGAGIVVVERDPRDVGLSLWRNHFRDGAHRYASTWEGIADQIALFGRAVAFWETALPGAVTRVAYEDVLEAPEVEARRLLDACGLGWDPAVLAFHERAGTVRTLSFAQVRQPIYKTSKGGWREVEAHLGPLLAALAARGLLPEEGG